MRIPLLPAALVSVIVIALAAVAAVTASTLIAVSARGEMARWVDAFPGLAFDKPLFVGPAPEGGDAFVVLEQPGRVLRVPAGATGRSQVQVMLDLTPEGGGPVSQGYELGALGLAFAPDVRQSRHVYLHYTRASPTRNLISRFTMAPDFRTIDVNSEEVLLEVPQPFDNHNGGAVAFGPDGMLYIALGDGGAAGDPKNNAQDLGSLLGVILRIDVTPGAEDAGLAYAVPPGNPFVGVEGARPEIWAWGLRNPWQISFDAESRRLWAGDVGQNAREEINVIRKGGNYGWRIREGFEGYKPDQAVPVVNGEPVELLDPVVDHPRNEARSITGGRVYRGRAVPLLAGAYVYGDFVTGNCWALWYDRNAAEPVRQLVRLGALRMPSSFGEGPDGELYATDFVRHRGGPAGRVMRLVAE